MAKIYCRDEDEITRLKTKYPDIDAEWKLIPEDRDNLETPVVCNNDEPLEMCPAGENYIANLALEQKTKNET